MQFKYLNTNGNDLLYHNLHSEKPTDDQGAFQQSLQSVTRTC